jgi:hypothetical protein
VLALVIVVVVVVAAIGIVFAAITREIPKPATESGESRRAPAHRSRRSRPDTVPGKGMEVVASAGLTVVATGKQVGQSIAELAKSTVAGPSPNGGSDATAMSTEDDLPEPAAPHRPRGQAVPSWQRTDHIVSGPEEMVPPATTGAVPAATATVPLQRVPTAPRMRVAEPVAAPALTRADMRRLRLYPRWWQRLRSLVILAILVLAAGLGVGAAIGYVLISAYRLISGSL